MSKHWADLIRDWKLRKATETRFLDKVNRKVAMSEDRPEGEYSDSSVYRPAKRVHQDEIEPEDRPKERVLQPGSQSGWIEAPNDAGWFYGAERITPLLNPGVYTLFVSSDKGPMFKRQFFPSDVALDLPGLPTRYILDQIKEFWKEKEKYYHYGFLQKRGIVLYGPPGCGKTCIIRLLCDQMIKLGGIIFNVNNFVVANQCLNRFRQIEKNRPILTLQEDVEGLFMGEGGPAQVQAALSMLDGQDQVDNVVHIATTNMPEQIADRFIRRPGRYDLVIGIHNPNRETREAYLRSVVKNEIPEEKMKELIDKTDGLAISYLRELASTFLCLGIPLDETLARLRLNQRTKVFSVKSNSGSAGRVGFTIGYEGEGSDR